MHVHHLVKRDYMYMCSMAVTSACSPLRAVMCTVHVLSALLHFNENELACYAAAQHALKLIMNVCVTGAAGSAAALLQQNGSHST